MIEIKKICDICQKKEAVEIPHSAIFFGEIHLPIKHTCNECLLKHSISEVLE